MNRSFSSFVAALILIPTSQAAENTEITIEKRPFVIRHAFSASIIPAETSLLEIKAAAWGNFEITRIAPHGSRVSKGDVLVAFDAEEIDQKLKDVRRSIDTRTLELAQARDELRHLEQTTPHRLEALKRAAAEAREENAYFTKTRRKASEESADQSLRRSEISLENEREELRQLEKMYAADDLTEETEEIILKRQKDQVIAAEFALRMQQLSHKRTREVLLPREAVTLADAERDTAIALSKFEEEAPRSISLKKLGLESLETAAARDKEQLAKLEADRKQFEFTAPSDGWFYHGVIENGRWITGDLLKTLVTHGNPPPRKPFATFIPANAKMKLVAALDGNVARQLRDDLSGNAFLPGREDAEFPVRITRIAAVPEPDGRFTVELSATWPKVPSPAPAAQAAVNIITYENPSAIVLPAKALQYGSNGWTVSVKLADGKTERRPVKRGLFFNDECEIISGVEAGQVVVP